MNILCRPSPGGGELGPLVSVFRAQHRGRGDEAIFPRTITPYLCKQIPGLSSGEAFEEEFAFIWGVAYVPVARKPRSFFMQIRRTPRRAAEGGNLEQPGPPPFILRHKANS